MGLHSRSGQSRCPPGRWQPLPLSFYRTSCATSAREAYGWGKRVEFSVKWGRSLERGLLEKQKKWAEDGGYKTLSTVQDRRGNRRRGEDFLGMRVMEWTEQKLHPRRVVMSGSSARVGAGRGREGATAVPVPRHVPLPLPLSLSPSTSSILSIKSFAPKGDR